MLVVWMMEYFLLSSGKLSYTVAMLWFKIFLSSLPLCCFVLYCILKLLSRFLHFHRGRSNNYESLLTFPDRLINNQDDDDDDDDSDDGNK